MQGYAQFVAWPGLLVFQDQARLVYDGSALGVPTFHGVVVRQAYAKEHPDVLQAFLQAQIDATNYLHEHPVEAAEAVAKATGLPPEVVYLYNGRDGIASFDVTVKPQLLSALQHDEKYLKIIGTDFTDVDVTKFANDSYIRKAYGASYDADTASTANPAKITGTDEACGTAVSDPAKAGELWLAGEDRLHPRPPPPACCARSPPPSPRARPCGPRTCPTRPPERTGSRTSRSGCATPRRATTSGSRRSPPTTARRRT